MKRHKFRVTFFIILLVCAGRANGAIVLIEGKDPGVGPGGARPNSDAAAAGFDSAAALLGPVSIIDFEGENVGGFVSREVAPGVAVTFFGNDIGDAGQGIATDNMGAGGPTILGYNTTLGGTKHLRMVPLSRVGTATVVFDYAAPIQAWGAYLTGLGTADGSLFVTFDDGMSQEFNVTGDAGGGVQFFGFTDAGKSIVSIGLELRGVSSSRDIFGVDDVRHVAIPEPSSLLLLCMGVFGFLTYARRRRK